MALATGALAKSAGTTVNHIVNGAQVVNAAFSASGDIDNAFANADGYLWCDVVLTYERGAAGTAGLTVVLYRRYLDVLSTNDEPVPATTFRGEVVRVKVSNNVTGLQYAVFENIWIGGRPCEFYIENLTGQTISNTWDLDVLPWTYKAA
jgi:hypothetical protein